MCTAPCIAAAALDPHDISVEVLTVWAVKVEPHSVGEGGRAAAVIAAGPTGARVVSLFCGASGEGDSDWFLLADSSLTLFTLLDSYRKLQVTPADLAQPGLFDQPTVWVVIGHPT